LGAFAALAVTIGFAPAADATNVLAQKGNACSATWQTGEASAVPNRNLKKPWTLTCTDGDPSCDTDGAVNGECVVGLSACALQASVLCTPEQLSQFKFGGKVKKFAGLVAPDTTFANCGAGGRATLKLKGKTGKAPKPSAKLNVFINFKTTPAGKGKNTLIVQCVPNPECTALPCNDVVPPVVGTCNAICPNNSAIVGQPKQLCLQVPLANPQTNSNGSDLDTGFTGTSHNFPVVGGASLRYCLSNCDGTTDTLCDASGDTGPGSLNGETFGAPLPLLSAGVPVCVVNRFQPGPITGTFDMVSGEGGVASGPNPVNLFSDTYLRIGNSAEVCPRCVVQGVNDSAALGQSGKCSSTARNPGAACVVDGFVKVVGGSGEPNYTLSSSCPPPQDASNPTVLDIPLRLTTGTSTSPPGPNPCPGQNTPDSCPGGAACTAACTDCASTGPNGECIDPKGGIAQVCCASDPRKSCFPTRSGGSITRQGTPGTAKALFATAFCIPATRASLINSTAGLPGPGALLLPADPVTRLNHVP
jgi:hypothetical protein